MPAPRRAGWSNPSSDSRSAMTSSRLDYEVVIVDPETLLEPLVLRWHWDWVPGEALQAYDCTLVE